ncbi:MAG: tRNA (guanosine(46)-N7)-methyltransferase TrmB [Bacteroidales bacterium]
MGKNKLRNFNLMKSYEHVFQPAFMDIFQKDFYLKGKWANDYFHNQNPVILELGCGKGEYTTGLAERNPGKNYIGIDIKGARISKGAKITLEKSLGNVAFIRSAIEPIGSFFAENEIDEIWLTFSDPQLNKPKKRLTSSVFLNKYLNFLKPNGIVHLKTDNRILFEYTLALANDNNFIINIQSTDIYSDLNLPEEVTGIQTFYEKKFMVSGQKINYLQFTVSQKKQIIEPEDALKFRISDYNMQTLNSETKAEKIKANHQ